MSILQKRKNGTRRVEFGDGIVTGMGTFQKYYTQAELKQYLESQLGAEAVPASLGVYYLLRNSPGRKRRPGCWTMRRESARETAGTPACSRLAARSAGIGWCEVEATKGTGASDGSGGARRRPGHFGGAMNGEGAYRGGLYSSGV